MKRTVVILCIWLFLGMVVMHLRPELAKLIYSITMVFLSFLLWHTYKGAKWIMLPFIISVPPAFAFAMSLIIPSIKDLVDTLSIIAVLGGSATAIIKIIIDYDRNT